MTDKDINAAQRPHRVATSGTRTARPSADATVLNMQATKAEMAAKAAAEAKLQADLRASLTVDAKPKGGLLARILGR